MHETRWWLKFWNMIELWLMGFMYHWGQKLTLNFCSCFKSSFYNWNISIRGERCSVQNLNLVIDVKNNMWDWQLMLEAITYISCFCLVGWFEKWYKLYVQIMFDFCEIAWLFSKETMGVMLFIPSPMANIYPVKFQRNPVGSWSMDGMAPGLIKNNVCMASDSLTVAKRVLIVSGDFLLSHAI